MRIEHFPISTAKRMEAGLIEENYACDDCGESFIPKSNEYICEECQIEDWKRNPHPLDVAEMEHQQDEFPDFINFGE